jgi:hypothetical protein
LDVAHASFTLADGYAVGSIATFVADPGFSLVGNTQITCESGGAWSGEPPIATAPPPTAVPGGGTSSEGDAGSHVLHVPITLSSPSTLPVTIAWNTLYVPGAPNDTALGEQADPATDNSTASGTIVLPSGQTVGAALVPVRGDTLVERDEYVVVSFHNPIHAKMGGFWGLGFGGILNDDVPRVLPGGGSSTEGDAGTGSVTVPVTLSQPSFTPVTVSWNTVYVAGAPDNTALGVQADPGTDYSPVSGTVEFAPGQSSANITVPIIGDVVSEGNEYFVVSFHDPINAKMGGFWGLGFAGILNDDG